MLEHYTDGQVAREHNRRGIKPSMGKRFNRVIVAKLRRENGLATRYDRLRGKGLLTQEEMAEECDVIPQTIRVWYANGLLIGYDYDDKGGRSYPMPDEHNRPCKSQGQKLCERRVVPQLPLQAANEVQHEA